MNERIEIVSETYVRIQRNSGGQQSATEVTIRGNDLCLNNDTVLAGVWDALGRAALRDCINCLEATGNFAALADTSAVPFVGKRMRHKLRERYEYTVLDASDPLGKVLLQRVDDIERICTHRNELLPITAPEPPKPKVRPYTPVEAVQHLGREMNWDYGHANQKLIQVGLTHALIAGDQGYASYESLAEHYRWADTNEPCGILEQ